MKKAKIMLSALGVLAIVGGALAFKSNNVFGGKLRCTTITNHPTTFCPDLTYTAAIGENDHACTLKTAPLGVPCAITHAAPLQ